MGVFSWTKDYSKSPAKNFDAVQDVKEYFSERWDTVSALMGTIKNAHSFSVYADFAGVRGFPVVAWYDHYNGEGAFQKAWDAEEKEKQQ